MSDFSLLTLDEVTRALHNDDVTPVEVLDAVLERAGRLGPLLGCFVTVLESQSRRVAAELARARRDERPPLWGVPISIKDNIDVHGVPTTAGSAVRGADPAERDAPVVARLKAAGAVIFAKASLYEFAFGAGNPAFGLARNPWSLNRSTGGSSSGSVAAVAARLGYASIGTDTGGSIRVPAGFCGVVGLKPTYDHVSTKGVVPVAWTLDHVGPIARTSRDCAVVYDAIRERRSVPPTLSELHDGVSALHIGTALIDNHLIPIVRQTLESAVDTLAASGAELKPVNMPDMSTAQWCLWVISSAEAADYHRAMLDQRGSEYHPLVRRRLLRGRLLPAADYVRAQRLRNQLCNELIVAMAGLDALVLPLAPVPAYDLNDRSVQLPTGVEDASSAVTRYTPLFSLTGWPAVAVPCGLTPEGLPVGIQAVARPGREATALRIASALERVTQFHQQLPHDLPNAANAA
jgi:aspartyl-tRNA(Asn)/glutamyl-tRNA(Gln) amidotransferase subunit A